MRELANEYAHEHAVYWYQYALDHGNAYAYYPLGIAYQFGYGVEKDLKIDKGIASCFLAKSAALGNERARELFNGLKKDGKL